MDRFPLCFDLVKLYAGCANLSRSWATKGFTVFPVELYWGWNMEDPLLFSWLRFMIAKGRIWFLWAGPPCTTFSIARHPRLRNSTCPNGFDLTDYKTLCGNLHLLKVLYLGWLQSLSGGWFAIEQLGTAFTKKLPWWVYVRDTIGALETLLNGFLKPLKSFRQSTKVSTALKPTRFLNF